MVMKRNRIDNTGFSLVEIIIVIAIMAILAAALAPQLVKYLEQSREASDHQVTESVKSCFNAAVKNEDVYKEVTESGKITFDITFDSNGSPQWPTTDFPKLSKELEISLNDIHPPKTSNTNKYVVSWTNSNFEVTGVTVVTA